jgi:hypothetical protein
LHGLIRISNLNIKLYRLAYNTQSYIQLLNVELVTSGQIDKVAYYLEIHIYSWMVVDDNNSNNTFSDLGQIWRRKSGYVFVSFTRKYLTFSYKVNGHYIHWVPRFPRNL